MNRSANGLRCARPGRRRSAVGIGSGFTGSTRAQSSNQIEAKPQMNVEETRHHPSRKQVWVLNFRFGEPLDSSPSISRARAKTLLVPQVRSHQPDGRTALYTLFELVTTDIPGHVYRDQVLPKAQEAIKEQEDPLNHMKILNSQTISESPIPITRPGGPPKPVTGVAIWDDVPSDANRFSIFVSGLSNGYSLAEIPPDNKQIVRSKTLQLNFKRVGDRFNQQTGDIRFVQPVEWVYRATGVVLPPSGAKAPPVGK